jgi:molybdopterin molybdotransferase
MIRIAVPRPVRPPDVLRRPRVGVLVTGDEVVPPGEPLAPGQIWNSNGPMVAAQVRQAGGEPVSLGVASDAPEAVRAKLAAIDGLDLLVTTGGISVGDFDVVKQVLLDEGRIDLWRVRMKPGGPLAFGRIGATPVIGLPGNPVAAAVASWQFVGPAIRTMLGHAAPALRTVQACIEDRIENRGGRRQFVRVALRRETDGCVAALAGSQGSHMLTSLMKGNGLLIIPESCGVAEPGSMFPVQAIDASA